MNTDTKVVLLTILGTVIVIIGAVFYFSKNQTPNVPPEQIVATNGLHWHPRLDIYIKGKKQEIPANVGIGAIHQEIHTHDDATDGILHMEMSGLVTRDETRLGRFFQIWGKKFDSNHIFDKINGEEGTVKLFVNGEENKKFENYEMQDKDLIEIRYE